MNVFIHVVEDIKNNFNLFNTHIDPGEKQNKNENKTICEKICNQVLSHI